MNQIKLLYELFIYEEKNREQKTQKHQSTAHPRFQILKKTYSEGSDPIRYLKCDVFFEWDDGVGRSVPS